MVTVTHTGRDAPHNLPTDDPVAIWPHTEWATRTTITLICGPPGSGKTTLGRKLHPRLLDMDDIPPGTPRERMRAYGLAAHKAGCNPLPNLAVIRGAPLTRDRLHLERLCKPHHTIVLLTPADVCHQRIDARNRNDIDGRDVAGQHQAVDDWWRDYDGTERTDSDQPMPW